MLFVCSGMSYGSERILFDRMSLSVKLEIDLLLRLYPDDEDAIYQIVNLLVDTCDSKRLAMISSLR